MSAAKTTGDTFAPLAQPVFAVLWIRHRPRQYRELHARYGHGIRKALADSIAASGSFQRWRFLLIQAKKRSKPTSFDSRESRPDPSVADDLDLGQGCICGLSPE